MTPTIEPARLVIPAVQSQWRTYDALCLLLVAERDGRVFAWCGYNLVQN